MLMVDGLPLDVTGTLKQTLTFFDKNLMVLAPNQSWKSIAVKVNGCLRAKVTQESEILVTWSIEQQINKTPEYKRLASAQEAWVVHFTCEDGYLLT
ncbi:4670_t:CDS:2 [Paraglomus occultum]|uniref:4670_t:CDS:1 n=1 Tax=Paraglomus occultum TaxID=144539 RepID=A0A9N8Z6M3_9GLOM|nr:4670_t:CDS:2 [Paraglomus occultum]